MIEDLDVVVLKNNRPDKNLKAGAIGTVVSVYENGKAFLVEFSELEESGFPLVDLTAEEVRPVTTNEIENRNKLR